MLLPTDQSLPRLHMQAPGCCRERRSQYLGTFTGKHETRHAVADPVDIYQHDAAILKRIAELAALGRVMRPSNARDSIRTLSGSCRCVVKRDWPGRRTSSQG
jgi:hypothetical protein